MRNAKLAPVLVAMGVTAAMWGCGDDDKPPSGTGGRNTAGTSGKAGAAGKGGNAGAAGKGGTAGKGGGGAGGSAGATGGAAGKGGNAGTAGSGGTAGAPMGGQGGEGGEPAGGAGGEAGSSSTLTIEQACAASCQDQTNLACDDQCILACTDTAALTEATTEYAALIRCQATELGPNDYVCREQPSSPQAPDKAGLVWDGPCETELCAWTCTDGTFGDEETFGHCDC